MSKDREQILKSMLDGVKPPLGEDETKRLAAALNAFSEKQLERLDDAGVRIWPFVKGMPPEYQVTLSDLGSPAAYHYQTRTIRVRPESLKRGNGTEFVRHELAHAWDDIRTDDKTSTNLRKLKGSALSDEFNRLAKEKKPFRSEWNQKLPPDKKWTMQEMLDRYRENLKGVGDKTLSFANASTADSHNAKNVKEFYAEGYSVFHGHAQDSQARLLWLATRLYNYLDHEADLYGQRKPPRKDLETYLDTNHKGWKAWTEEKK